MPDAPADEHVPVSDAELATLLVNLRLAHRNGGGELSPKAAGLLLRAVAEVERCRVERKALVAVEGALRRR